MTELNKKSNIALLTDFGTRGQHYVASMKAIILKINPNVTIVDISHSVSPYSIIEASYLLKSTYYHFPKRSIFIIVVDPGVGSSREIISIKTDANFYFIGPNNGIFSNVFDISEITECILIENEEFFNKPTSKTFHGRDIMAPIGAHISNGIPLSRFGPDFKFNKLIEHHLFYKIFPREKKIKCIIQFIDSFGNGTTNIPVVNNKIKNLNLELKNELKILIEIRESGYECIFTTHYSNVPLNSILIVIGSTSFLELSINQGNASKELDFKVGDIITFKF